MELGSFAAQGAYTMRPNKIMAQIKDFLTQGGAWLRISKNQKKQRKIGTLWSTNIAGWNIEYPHF